MEKSLKFLEKCVLHDFEEEKIFAQKKILPILFAGKWFYAGQKFKTHSKIPISRQLPCH